MSDQAVANLMAPYPQGEESVIEILHDVQNHYRYLPREALEAVAEYCRVPLARIMAVATFYKAFSLTPKGEKIIRICMGTACHVKGASLIKDEAERMLGCRCGETTSDGKITLEEVNCVGACAMAPVVIEDEQYHGKFKPVDMKTLLKTGGTE